MALRAGAIVESGVRVRTGDGLPAGASSAAGDSGHSGVPVAAGQRGGDFTDDSRAVAADNFQFRLFSGNSGGSGLICAEENLQPVGLKFLQGGQQRGFFLRRRP